MLIFVDVEQWHSCRCNCKDTHIFRLLGTFVQETPSSLKAAPHKQIMIQAAKCLCCQSFWKPPTASETTLALRVLQAIRPRAPAYLAVYKLESPADHWMPSLKEAVW